MEKRFVDFCPEHFERMWLRPEDAADIAGIDKETLLECWQGGRTLLVNDEPALVYGVQIQDGTGAIWSLTSPLFAAMPLFGIRMGRNVVRALFEAGCHRVEALCHAEN
ncbi:hypothetical protein LJC23_04270, partial [Desulfovibrio sp. OttesenSCG-928-I05]|nr:hypothetical protein [Desulfovibrio sp. OttesenSCG-928-I05]